MGVHLPSRPDQSTRAEITDSGRQLHLHHQAFHESVELPAQVAVPASTAALPIPEGDSVDFSWRLPVIPTEIDLVQFSPENQAIPWTSLDIEIGSQVACRKCSHDFVQEDVIQVWKDLPSENWAEMMEFWHCHKPHDHSHDHQHSQSSTSKGYGANNAISAQTGVGFVDLTSFLFSETDCKGLTVSAQRTISYLATLRFVPAYELMGGQEDDHVGIKNLAVIWPSIQTPKISAFVVPIPMGGNPVGNLLSRTGSQGDPKTQPPSFIQSSKEMVVRRLKCGT